MLLLSLEGLGPGCVNRAEVPCCSFTMRPSPRCEGNNGLACSSSCIAWRRSFIHSFIRPSVRPFVHPSTHSSIEAPSSSLCEVLMRWLSTMTYVDVALHELNDIQGLGWAGLGCHTATSQNGICYTRQQKWQACCPTPSHRGLLKRGM